MQSHYGFGKAIHGRFDEILERTVDALRKEGFGVLSDIDVSNTLKTKLGIDMRPYRILGACNPSFANQALSADPSIGLLLPCNVVVREADDGAVHVEFMDPGAVLKLVDSPGIAALSEQVRQRLSDVMNSLPN